MTACMQRGRLGRNVCHAQNGLIQVVVCFKYIRTLQMFPGCSAKHVVTLIQAKRQSQLSWTF